MLNNNPGASHGGGTGGTPQTVQQGIDTLASAMKCNIIPDQEYLLQGSVFDQHVDVLKHRLRGLCDNIDSGHEVFQERELVFSIMGSTSQPLNLRVRRPLDPSLSSECPWQLRYIGQPELTNRATIVRSCYDIACSENVVEFLIDLGCRLDYEYITKGFLFRKGRMKVTVSKLFKILQPPGPVPPPPHSMMENLEPITTSHLIELSVLAPSGSDAVADDMKSFAEQLKPIVLLDKIDPKRAGN